MSDLSPLFSLPTGYRDYTNVSDEFILSDQSKCYRLVVQGGVRKKRDRVPRIMAQVRDQLGRTATACAFGNVGYWQSILKPGQVIHVVGKVSLWNDRLQIVMEHFVDEAQVGLVVPQYREQDGSTVIHHLNNQLSNAEVAWKAALSNINESVILSRAGISEFRSLSEILVNLHDPGSIERANAASRCVEKLAALELLLEAKASSKWQFDPVSALDIDPHVVADLVCRLPFSPTADQVNAITETLKDLNSTKVMKRLLSGDVGTGKSTVIGVCAVAAWVAGKQVGILAPNVTLANQLVADIQSWWPEADVNLVLGSSKASGSLKKGAIVVGTTALFKVLEETHVDFLIVDEQHKLARKQRERLLSSSTNLLECTATCVPRTQALIEFGHMSISVLKDCPVKNVRHTFHLNQRDKDVLLQKVRLTLRQKGQVAIIYSRREGDKDDAYHVESGFKLWSELFPGQVRMVHGKLEDAQKLEVIQDMKDKRASILVASSVLEVGITIPDLLGLIIVNPERFGLSQMHQMRGRVARKGGEGWCCLYTPEIVEEDALVRIRLMCNIQDGFELADRDLELRGFGDLGAESDRQTGQGISKLWKGVRVSPSAVRCLLEGNAVTA